MSMDTVYPQATFCFLQGGSLALKAVWASAESQREF